MDAAARNFDDARIQQHWFGEGLCEGDNRDMAAEQSFDDVPFRSCTPTKETLAHIHTVTVNGLTRWKLAGGAPCVDEVEFCFQAVRLVFPREAVDLILEQVSRYVLRAAGRKWAKLCRGSRGGTCWQNVALAPTGD